MAEIAPWKLARMRPPAARQSEQIIALYERAAAVLAPSAAPADQPAQTAARAGDTACAALEQSRVQRARRAAETGRRNARRLRLGAQADRIFGDPPCWRA